MGRDLRSRCRDFGGAEIALPDARSVDARTFGIQGYPAGERRKPLRVGKVDVLAQGQGAAALYAAPVLRFTTPRRPATARATELFPLPAGPSMATRMPPMDPGSIAESPAASP